MTSLIRVRVCFSRIQAKSSSVMVGRPLAYWANCRTKEKGNVNCVRGWGELRGCVKCVRGWGELRGCVKCWKGAGRVETVCEVLERGVNVGVGGGES